MLPPNCQRLGVVARDIPVLTDVRGLAYRCCPGARYAVIVAAARHNSNLHLFFMASGFICPCSFFQRYRFLAFLRNMAACISPLWVRFLPYGEKCGGIVDSAVKVSIFVEIKCFMFKRKKDSVR